MNTQDLELLNSKEAADLLARYSGLRNEELEGLMFKVNSVNRSMLRAVVTLIKLRNRVGDKFRLSDRMFFTADGAGQSTGEVIARYIAGRFGSGKKIVDLTCSIGGNSIFLAQENKIVAVDRNEVHIYCARVNASVYGVDDNIDFVVGEVSDNIVGDADAFFIDPERARSGKTKTRSFVNSSPNIVELLPEIMKVTSDIGVKISPAFDYDELLELPEQPEVEVISENNVCKVVMLWFGGFKTCNRRATCFIDSEMHSYTDNDKLEGSVMVVDKPLSYIYEPNKAIIKAHLINEIADRFSLFKLDENIAYLTSDSFIESEKIFRVLLVLDFDIYSVKKIKNILNEKAISRVNIITRRFPTKIEDLYRKLKIKEGGDVFLIFTTLSDNKRYFILTEIVK